MQNKVKQLEQDDKGNVSMSKLNLKLICEQDELFEQPNLNTKLFLNFKGFYKLENLDLYINLRVLYLENNFITKIENLGSLSQLQHLFLQNNMITKIQGLDQNFQLSTLNLSNNSISKIESIGHLKQLNNLDLKGNALKNINDIEELRATNIATLDLIDNQIEYDEQLLEIFKSMSNLKCLYLKNNPCVREFKHYRRLFIGNIQSLNYFESRNVTEQERQLCLAWVEGGEDKMKKLQEQFNQEKIEQKKQQSEELRQQSKEKRKQRIQYFEKEIKKSIILTKKYKGQLIAAKNIRDEQSFNYFQELQDKEIQNIQELEQLLIDMKKQIFGTQQNQEQSQGNLQNNDQLNFQIDQERILFNQDQTYNQKNQNQTSIESQENQQELEMFDAEIEEILSTIIEQNPYILQEEVLREFEKIINEICTKLGKNAKLLSKTKIQQIIIEKMAKCQLTYQNKIIKDVEYLNELD